MNTNYFSTAKTVAEIKALYRELAMRHHPDRGGDTATMQEINRQYTQALKRCDGATQVGDDGRERTYTYDSETEQAIIDFIDRLVKSGALADDQVKAWLIGTWVWVVGETKPIKDTLKALGCRWHSKRNCWYWTPEERRSFYSKKGLGALAAQYGASEIVGDDDGRKGSTKQQRRRTWRPAALAA